MRTLLVIFSFILLPGLPTRIFAATPPATVYHLAPNHWYTGMGDTLLEIIFHSENSDLLDIEMDDYPGVRWLGKSNSANRHVAYLTLSISREAKPGLLSFTAKPASRRVRYVKGFKFSYELKARKERRANADRSDFFYRLNLDHFFNGNERNDRIQLKNPYDFNVSKSDARHGGDLAGLENGLGYITDLGANSIWINPVHENDAPQQSYTGLNITDHYSVDPRLGSVDQFRNFTEQCEKTGTAIYMDLQINHAGWFHWMYQHFDTGWFNDPDSTRFPLPDTKYLGEPTLTPTEARWLARHWMDPSQPDFNHENPHIRKFFIQYCIWWTEYANISGWIVSDPYLIEPGYLQELISHVKTSIPQVRFIYNVTNTNLYSQTGPLLNHTANRVVDNLFGKEIFALSMSDTCEPSHWTGLYNLLLNREDFKISAQSLDPITIQIEKGDIKRHKMLLELALASSSTPVLSAGSETSEFSSCQTSACIKNLQSSEKYVYTKKLIAIRKATPAFYLSDITTSVLAPSDGVFSFFKTTPDKLSRIWILCNDNPVERIITTKRFGDYLSGYSSMKDLVTGERSLISEFLILPAHSARWFSLSE